MEDFKEQKYRNSSKQAPEKGHFRELSQVSGKFLQIQREVPELGNIEIKIKYSHLNKTFQKSQIVSLQEKSDSEIVLLNNLEPKDFFKHKVRAGFSCQTYKQISSNLNDIFPSRQQKNNQLSECNEIAVNKQTYSELVYMHSHDDTFYLTYPKIQQTSQRLKTQSAEWKNYEKTLLHNQQFHLIQNREFYRLAFSDKKHFQKQGQKQDTQRVVKDLIRKVSSQMKQERFIMFSEIQKFHIKPGEAIVLSKAWEEVYSHQNRDLQRQLLRNIELRRSDLESAQRLIDKFGSNFKQTFYLDYVVKGMYQQIDDCEYLNRFLLKRLELMDRIVRFHITPSRLQAEKIAEIKQVIQEIKALETIQEPLTQMQTRHFSSSSSEDD